MNNEQIARELGIPVIDANRKYWLVRTEKGSLWEEFKADSYIAINWNEFSNLSELAETDDSEAEKDLKIRIAELYEVDKPGTILNTIRRFVFEMQQGDVIMIPSPKSKIISFGIVTSDCYIHTLTDEDFDNDLCDYIKRRNVRWIKDINKNNLDPLLFKMLQAHQAVASANDYANVIDRTLEPIYVKQNEVHIKIDINTPNRVGKNLVSLQSLIYDEDMISDSNNVHIKLNVQSPGFVEILYTYLPDALKLAFVLNILIGGGKALGFELPGIIDLIEKYKRLQSSGNDKKIEKEKIEIELLQKFYGEDLKTLEIGILDNELLNNVLKAGKNIEQNKIDRE